MFQGIKVCLRACIQVAIAVFAFVAYVVVIDELDQTFGEWYRKHINWEED